MGEKEFFAVKDLIEEDVLCRTVSNGEQEGALNELTAKFFDSDPEMHVFLKKVKVVRKEKSIVVLECRTHSKKFI